MEVVYVAVAAYWLAAEGRRVVGAHNLVVAASPMAPVVAKLTRMEPTAQDLLANLLA
jgi:hypothetical protein